MDPEWIVIELIGRVVLGAIAAAIASHKGRSVVGWFFGGFFLFILGVIIVSCLSNLVEKRRRDSHTQQENRRLREQLMQEQIKNETFRRHAMARLDTHDNQLGVDTRSVVSALPAPGDPFSTPALEDASGRVAALPPAASTPEDFFAQLSSAPGAGAAEPIRAAVPQPGRPLAAEVVDGRAPAAPFGVAPQTGLPTRQWHYESGGTTQGPVNDRQLVGLAQQGTISAETLIWTEQLGDWKPARQIKALQPYLRS